MHSRSDLYWLQYPDFITWLSIRSVILVFAQWRFSAQRIRGCWKARRGEFCWGKHSMQTQVLVRGKTIACSFNTRPAALVARSQTATTPIHRKLNIWEFSFSFFRPMEPRCSLRVLHIHYTTILYCSSWGYEMLLEEWEAVKLMPQHPTPPHSESEDFAVQGLWCG